MGRRFDCEAYLAACQEGREILEFCKNNNITSYATLIESREQFPENKKEVWFKRLLSLGFIRFLRSKGIR